MLRRQLGDAVFHQFIRSYYEQYKEKNADTRDLETVAEKVSGKNLDVFFRQWLYATGLPQLTIRWKYLTKEKKIIITVEQTQKKRLFSVSAGNFNYSGNRKKPGGNSFCPY